MPPHYCFHILPHIFQQLMWSTQNKKTELLTQKNSLKRRFSEKGGPSDRIRTGGILLPNLSGILFPLVYSGFRRFLICFTYSLTLLSPLFPGVPAPSVVIYVVKNASRPAPVNLHRRRTGSVSHCCVVCIVTLDRQLCKRFLRGWRLRSCGAIDKE